MQSLAIGANGTLTDSMAPTAVRAEVARATTVGSVHESLYPTTEVGSLPCDPQAAIVGRQVARVAGVALVCARSQSRTAAGITSPNVSTPASRAK